MKQYVYLIIGGIILLSGLTRPFLGFVSSGNDFAMGQNIGTATFYIIGIILIILFFRENRKNRKKKN